MDIKLSNLTMSEEVAKLSITILEAIDPEEPMTPMLARDRLHALCVAIGVITAGAVNRPEADNVAKVATSTMELVSDWINDTQAEQVARN